MPDIEDYKVYNDRMRRSLWDKAFFMDKIPGAKLLIDFGCADGSLIRFFAELFPSMYYIGFDIDANMIRAARACAPENSWFFDDEEQVLEQVKRLGVSGRQIALNFSSVLHEVFHYGADLSRITRFIRQLAPEYIVVRDMMYDSPEPEAPAPAAAVERLRQRLPGFQIADFEQCFGSVKLRKNLVHLLLKYNYRENWARECAENYFSYSLEQLYDLVDPDRAFRPILQHRYILPWSRSDMENNLGIDPGQSLTTHISLILARSGRDSHMIIL